MTTITALAAALFFGLDEPTPAADPGFLRYELGRHLRDFEPSYGWVSPDRKAAAAAVVDEAVRAFFRMDLLRAAELLSTDAMIALGYVLTDLDRFVVSLAVRPNRRFIDASDAKVSLKLDRLWPTPFEIPEGTRFCIEGWDGVGDALRFELAGLPTEVDFEVSGLAEGDHRVVTFVVAADEQSLNSGEFLLSIVDHRDARLTAARNTLDAWPGDPAATTTDRESARNLLRLLEDLAAGQTTESDVYAAAELKELEAILAADAEGRTFHGPSRSGSHRVVLKAPKGRTCPARILVPENLDAAMPVPLVIALHGAGGTENLFFEGYGAGRIVGLCEERGWLLVAPRVTPFGGMPPADLIDAMAALYPVDRERVFLVGHSMGAAAAVRSACTGPALYAGVAALGGGGRVAASDALKGLPAFVGVGSLDFAVEGSRALDRALREAGLARVEFREYPDVEHLLVVQVALPEVFAFFDAIAGR